MNIDSSSCTCRFTSLFNLSTEAVLFLALAVALAACGDDGVSADPDSDPDSDPDAEVSVTASFTVDPDDPEVDDEVTLDGSNSSAEGSDELSFDWSLSTPSGSEADVDDPSDEVTHFTADVEGTYQVTLEVSADDATDSAAEDVDVEEEEEDDRVVWSRDVGVPLTTEPSLGPEGTIYASSQASEGGLIALDTNGDVKWSNNDLSVHTATASADGDMVYAGTYSGRQLHALNAETGEVQWTFDDNGELAGSGNTSIDDDGVIYLAAGKLYAIDSEADDDANRKIWSTEEDTEIASTSPSIDEAESLVYAGSTDGRLVAFSTDDGEKQWDIQINASEESLSSVPAIAQDGTVYVGSVEGALYAILPNGDVDWVFDEVDNRVDGDIAIGPDGDRIYFVTNSTEVGEQDRLYAVDTNGNEIWKTSGTSTALPSASPVIGDDGTIYYNVDDAVLAIDPDEGDWDWAFETDDHVMGGPVMANDGTIYIGSHDEHVYALESGSNGLSESSPWPLAGKDARRSGFFPE